MSTISASTTSTTGYVVTSDTTGTLVLQTGSTPTTAMTIDGSQNVGIGTSSPTSKLEVAGQINGSPLYIKSGGSTSTLFYDTALLLTQAGTGERMRIDSSGNVGQNTSAPATYNSSGKVFTQTGTANNSGPSAHMMQGSSSNPGAGYYCREAFALSGITSTATEITRITGTGSNGVGMYIRVTVSGHTSSIANAMNYKGVFYQGGTTAVTQVETATSGTIPVITFDTSTSNVLVIKLASASAGQNFNGVMVVEWFVPVDFSSNTWTIS